MQVTSFDDLISLESQILLQRRNTWLSLKTAVDINLDNSSIIKEYFKRSSFLEHWYKQSISWRNIITLHSMSTSLKWSRAFEMYCKGLRKYNRVSGRMRNRELSMKSIEKLYTRNWYLISNDNITYNLLHSKATVETRILYQKKLNTLSLTLVKIWEYSAFKNVNVLIY